MCLSLRANYPPQKLAVNLGKGEATEVRRVHLVRGVTDKEHDCSSWCFVAQTRSVMFARAGENVVFVREPCNLFDSCCVKVGLRVQV